MEINLHLPKCIVLKMLTFTINFVYANFFLLVSANPTDHIFLPPTLKFVYIFLKKTTLLLINWVITNQLSMLNVQFNVTRECYQYKSRVIVFNAFKKTWSLMKVKQNKNKKFTDLPNLYFSELLPETSNYFFRPYKVNNVNRKLIINYNFK